jgi:hypothetical protein
MGEGEPTTSPEYSKERWDYDGKFKEYLLNVAQEGKGALESINNYPERIGLNDTWHKILGKMRSETRDGLERWTTIGVHKDIKSIVIPTNIQVGRRNDIPVLQESDLDKLSKEYSRLEVRRLLGDIHSHPDQFVKENTLTRFLLSGRIISEYRGFSPTDLKGIIQLSKSASPLIIFGLVENEDNFFAFLTKDSETIPSDSPLLKNKEFSYHWFRKYAPGIGEDFLPKKSTLWEINIGIAKHYNLAIYRGKVDQDLVRGYPEIK